MSIKSATLTEMKWIKAAYAQRSDMTAWITQGYGADVYLAVFRNNDQLDKEGFPTTYIPATQRDKSSIKQFKTLDAAVKYIRKCGHHGSIELFEDVCAEYYEDPSYLVNRVEIPSSDGTGLTGTKYELSDAFHADQGGDEDA